MNNIQEIKELAELRIKEAELLFENGFYDGSIYLAGYSVELLLKAKICELLDVPDLFGGGATPEVLKSFKTHKLENLLTLSGRVRKLQNDKKDNVQLFNNWSLVCEWSEQKRYCSCGTCTKINAEKFLNAVTDKQNGIKSWLEQN